MATEPITVLYYDEPVSLTLKTTVLKNIVRTRCKRIELPGAFKNHKVIVAVFEGDCRLLNCLGERPVI